MTQSGRWRFCLLAGAFLIASAAIAQEPTSDLAQVQAIAESILAREEAASERAFDPAFRAKAKERLATLPLSDLLAQTGDNGLGLNILGDTQADLVYTPVTPCRIVDTRVAGGILSVGVPKSFRVTGTNYSDQGGSATSCGVPYGPATAVVINLVAVSAAGPGNLKITPFGQALPTASIINYATVQNVANGVAVAICNPAAATCTSDVTIQANVSPVHLVVDVQGYFRNVSAGGVSSALLADAAVTAPKIASGVAVRSLNAQTDTVTLAGANGLSVSAGSGTVTVTSNATSSGTASTIVARDPGGSFSAGSIALGGNLALPATTPTAGAITLGGMPFLRGFGYHTFVGSEAGNTTMTGLYNTGFGHRALAADTTGWGNSGFGTSALTANTTGQSNAAFGVNSLFTNTAGDMNAAFGANALTSNTTGGANVAVGFNTLFANTTGAGNTAVGIGALGQNDANNNTAVGNVALAANTTATGNVAVGDHALSANTTGWGNVAIGASAGINQTNGSNNIYLDNAGTAGENNSIHIGNSVHTATYVAGISAATVSGSAVYVNSNGQLGTATSSRRYKEQIVAMDAESDVLLKLRPVSFYYRPELDETHLRQYGLVAEEVAEVAPGLVDYDKDGQPQTVRYHFVNAMLLNEVQKQRRLVEEQRQHLAAQDAEIRDLRAQQSKILALEARLATLEAARGDQ